MHWSTTEKECFAVVYAVNKFHYFLADKEFDIVTDHIALKWLMTTKHSSNSKLARWAIFLQAYQFQIAYRKGKNHTNVDFLSRPVLLAQTRNKKKEEE